jgi:hypothetical protein
MGRARHEVRGAWGYPTFCFPRWQPSVECVAMASLVKIEQLFKKEAARDGQPSREKIAPAECQG